MSSTSMNQSSSYFSALDSSTRTSQEIHPPASTGPMPRPDARVGGAANTRRVATMDPARVLHKRHMDREAQRRNRERTKARITALEAETERLSREVEMSRRNGATVGKRAQELEEHNQRLREEVARLCTQLASARGESHADGQQQRNARNWLSLYDALTDSNASSGSASGPVPLQRTPLPLSAPVRASLFESSASVGGPSRLQPTHLESSASQRSVMSRWQPSSQSSHQGEGSLPPAAATRPQLTVPWPRPNVAPVEPPYTPFSTPDYVPSLPTTHPRQAFLYPQRLPPMSQDRGLPDMGQDYGSLPAPVPRLSFQPQDETTYGPIERSNEGYERPVQAPQRTYSLTYDQPYRRP